MRQTDYKKLENVKLAAIKEIVNRGYFGATISNIAKSAGVSDGYLYSHYKNKEELAKSLFIQTKKDYHTKLFERLNLVSTIQEFLKESCSLLTSINTESPEILEFFGTLTQTYHFKIPDEVKTDMKSLVVAIREKGINTGEISNETTNEEIMVSFFGISSKILEMRKKGLLPEEDPTNVAHHFSKLCLKSWK